MHETVKSDDGKRSAILEKRPFRGIYVSLDGGGTWHKQFPTGFSFEQAKAKVLASLNVVIPEGGSVRNPPSLD